MSAFSVASGIPLGRAFSSSEMMSASVTSVLSSFVALSMIWTSSFARIISAIWSSVT
jgi:hypothetical protein